MQTDHRVHEQSNLEYWLKESVFWIYSLFMLFYGIVLVSLMASGSTDLTNLKQSEAFILANETVNQWKERFILDIQTAGAEQDCPGGYESALHYNWAGTIPGCQCPFIDSTTNTAQTVVVKGRCSAELISYNCTDVNPQDPQDLQLWRGSYKVCVLRDPNFSMFATEDEQCLTTQYNPQYRKCGSGSRAICRKADDLCPITYLVDQSNIVGQSAGSTVSFGPTATYQLQTETPGQMPVYTLRLDEYWPCSNPALQNISPSKKGEYILLAQRRQYCPDQELRATLIDVIGEEELFRLNQNLWDTVMNKLPAYPRPSNDYNYTLTMQPYPLWSYNCRSQSDLNVEVLAKRLALTNEEYNQRHLIGTTVISVMFVSFILLIVEVRRKQARKNELARIKEVRADEKNGRSYLKYIPQLHRSWLRNTTTVMVIDRIFKLINVASIFIQYVEVSKAKTFFEDVFKQRCGDDYFYEHIFDEYNNATLEMHQFYGAMLGLWWFIFAIDWLYLFFRYFHEIKPIIDELEGRNKRIFPKRDDSNEDENEQEEIVFQKRKNAKRILDEDFFRKQEEIEAGVAQSHTENAKSGSHSRAQSQNVKHRDEEKQ